MAALGSVDKIGDPHECFVENAQLLKDPKNNIRLCTLLLGKVHSFEDKLPMAISNYFQIP
jgi:hypothetical protein